MATFISHSVTETIALGEAWGRTAPAGLVIGLSGDLGAGKTQLVKGVARGLGLTGRVTSPTFALVNEYAGGRLPLAHLDLYRLHGAADILGAGLAEYFTPAGLAVIEWMERWVGEPPDPARFPGRYRQVRIHTLGPGERQIDYEDFGA
jgi:tRNA threonylcarbamoyladenosine biosynthesis protein TsaE